MALIDFITKIQFGAIGLLRQQCERVGIRRPLIVVFYTAVKTVYTAA
jgi:hypothetical protein